MGTLDPAITSFVLESVGGDNFESFGQALLQQTFGFDFEPTGGMHDGGQDGFIRAKSGAPNQYIQISVRADWEKKIRQTIERLTESRGKPESLTYLTSRQITNKDILEVQIEKDTQVAVRIYDRRWITTRVQIDEVVGTLFVESFASAVQSTQRLSEHVPETFSQSERMSIMSYMEVHAASEPDEEDLLHLAVDSAIYLSLEGTDPDKKIFRSKEEIVEFVEKTFPSIKNRKDIDFDKKIERLCAKKRVPRIRHHRTDQGYCLPYDVRSEFSEHGMAVRNAEVAFWDSIRARLIEEALERDDVDIAVEAAAYAIDKTFEKQGLNLLASMGGSEKAEEVRTSSYVDQALRKYEDLENIDQIRKATQKVIRRAFYSPNEAENEHMFRLFKSFSIEFIIKGDASVATYFSKLIKKLHLYVGTDVIVRALSEECANPVGRATQNALKILSRAGAKLYLTEYVAEEVWHHIHSTDIEYRDFYKSWEKHVTIFEAQQSDKILIRAFFYGKLEPDFHEKNPTNWDQFLSYFGDANWFRNKAKIDAFTTFLRKKFSFEYVSKDEIKNAISHKEVAELETELVAQGKDEKLAWNDAYLSLYVRNRRKMLGDVGGTSIYGIANWWLTEEFKVLEALKKVGVRRQLVMHPQFLMNLFAASPGLMKTSERVKRLFPVHFGLRISSRVSPQTMSQFLEKVRNASEAEEAKAEAYIREQANEYLNTSYVLSGS